MPFFPDYDDSALFFSMLDKSSPWCRLVDRPFTLEDKEWKTVEHYVQAMRFDDEIYQEKIRSAETAEQAKKLGKKWLKPKRKDWKSLRTTFMTRALYMQCQMYPEMSQALLDTQDRRLVEDSQYDFFWGCGRDRRGENHYGKILMNIRQKLIQKSQNPCKA